ncbi:MAG: vWA domain-containing protein, partial [Planctomycetota bacterium]
LPTGSERIIFCVEAGVARGQIRNEVMRFLGTLPERAEFGLVAYASGAAAFKKKLVAASVANRDAAAKWMQDLALGDRAHLYEGLRLAFDLADGGKKKPARADTIVVVALRRPSEVGVAPTRVGNPRQIALEALRWNELLRVRVLAFGLSGGAESFYLQQMARPYGGGFMPSGR